MNGAIIKVGLVIDDAQPKYRAESNSISCYGETLNEAVGKLAIILSETGYVIFDIKHVEY